MHQFFIGFKKSYESIRREVLFYIVIEFGIPMNLARQIKVCLNETYSRVRVGKHLSHIFPIRNGMKQGDAVSLFIFIFAVGYDIRGVQVNQSGLKLNGTYQLLVYADN